MANILIVDDKRSMRKMLFESLLSLGYRVEQAENGFEAWEMVRKKDYDLIISDIKMADMDGIEFLERLRESGNDTQVVLMTAFGSAEMVVRAMRLGVADFVLKPFSLNDMEKIVKRVVESGINRTNTEFFKEEEKKKYDFSSITGESEKMRDVFELIKQVAPSKTNVLIMGESGTGKELVASAIHYHSERREGLFIKLNCGALSQNLVESELFGHVKGAFTGAVRDKKGRFSLADNGTLFLDEVGELELSTQVKLLRVIQEGEFERVGSEKTSRVDVRIIAATNRDLKCEVKEGRFREDLFYRLNVIAINLPPLREREEDVLMIADYFLRKFSKEYGKKIIGIDEKVREYFLRYEWPGNVRELQNVMERAVVLCRGDMIDLSLIPSDIKESGVNLSYLMGKNRGLTEILEEIEKNIIYEALEKNNWVQTRTAKKLGITRSALQYKMQKYALFKDGEE